MRGNSSISGLRQVSLLVASLVIGLSTITGLSGCSTMSNQPKTVVDEHPSPQSNQPLLLAVATSLQNGEFRNAAMQLQLLAQRPLSGSDEIEFLLLSAELQLRDGNPELAQDYLKTIQQLQQQARPEQERRAALIKAAILENQQQFLAAARERDFIASILTEQEWPQNHEQIWQDLMQLPEEELLRWTGKTPDTQFGQWLTLAAISKNSHQTLDEQLNAINNWRTAHPAHPAALELPGGLAMLADIAANRPTHIALLLPLSGPLSKTGKAVRDGFMAAYYQSLDKGYNTPKIQVYDSQQFKNIDDAYAAAQVQGAQWMIGPFNKLSVQALQQRSSLPLPTLALNYGKRDVTDTVIENRDTGIPPSKLAPTQTQTQTQTQTPSINKLYQFGLAAEDEAEQIAEQAWKDGHRRALVMMPKGDWGKRVYAAFEQRWQELGGEIGEQLYFSNRNDYNPEIKALLNVDDSQQRFSTMRRILAENTEFEPRRRQDVDWIFMVALPKQARQIKPTLKFNFAGDLPVYATSHVFSGIVNQHKDADLNGIRFCDVPWLLQSSELHTQLNNSLGNGIGPYARLYAMGVDAFRLLPRLKQLEAFPNSQLFGSTGALTLDDKRRIHRQTECTRFLSGKPERLASH